jgi:hypothetical protein
LLSSDGFGAKIERRGRWIIAGPPNNILKTERRMRLMWSDRNAYLYYDIFKKMYFQVLEMLSSDGL